MSKKQVLWLAFAGDELTCAVTVLTGAAIGDQVELKLEGIINPARSYIYNLIMDVLENANYDTVKIDVRNLVFVTGHTVNDCAIEQLLKLVCHFSGNGKMLDLMLEDGCVKDVLTQDLAGKTRNVVTLADGRSTGQPWRGQSIRWGTHK